MDDSEPRAVSQTPTSSSSSSSSSCNDYDDSCPFCTITKAFPPTPTTSDPSNANPSWNPDKLSPPAYVLLSTKDVVAFLDIAPLTRGHVLVAPRRHRVKVGDLADEEMAAIGRVLPLLAKSVTHTVLPDIPHSEADYNIVQNNGPGAAQVIPHVHFHIIPRPPLNYTPDAAAAAPAKIPTGLRQSYIQFGRGPRSELDDEDALALVEGMRREIALARGGRSNL